MFFSIHRGTYRTVVAVPALGLAFKVARIRVVELARELICHFEYPQARTFAAVRRYASRSLHASVDDAAPAKRLLFKGLVDNWREWRFSETFDHPILVPTYASIGLVNVQAYADPLPDQGATAHWRKIVRILDTHVRRDSHHFASNPNFGWRDGHLAMIDYASPKTHEVLRTYADRLVDQYAA